MLEVCLVGTGGMMPLTYRFLSSLLVRSEGSTLLIDCGEATQVAIRKAEYSTHPIDNILITHFHADHISGLVGLLLSMGNTDRTEPVNIVGPKSIKEVVTSLRVIAPELPFNLNFIELNDNNGFLELSPFRIEYFKLKHRITCLGYNIYLDRLAEFLPEKAKKNNVPLRFWNKLQHGEECFDEINNIKYTSDMVMGEERRGIKLSYFTDTRPCDNILNLTKDADLMIAEGMYGDIDKIDNAKSYKHMMMTEACEIAKINNPKELWLTHYSPSEVKPQIYEKELKKIFDNVKILKDGEKKIIYFE